MRPARLRGPAALALRRGLGALGALYLRLCWRTTRWTVERDPALDAALAQPGGVIAAFWHARLAFVPFCAPPGRALWAMVSDNRDGDLVSALLARFGVGLIRGSSADPRKPGKDKRGRAAAVAALRRLREGGVVSIAVDGPRGPAGVAKPGVAMLSQAAGAPVAPLAIATRGAFMLNSWDRFLLPRPFDRGAVVFGAPLAAAGPDAGLETHRAAVETALTALSARADHLAGRA